jgi:hypothetical protein
MDTSRLLSNLKDCAYFGDGGELQRTDIGKLINVSDLELFGQGMNTRVFRLKGTNWVVKEGKFDLDLSFITNLKIKFPVDVTQEFLANFGVHFCPTPDLIKAQYQDYLTFVTYFGYFDSQSQYYHPRLSAIIDKQQIIRSQLSGQTAQIEKAFWLSLPESISQIFTSETLYHNFVPAEYLLYGPSISPENNGQDTYFIFQEFCQGTTLHDIKIHSLPQNQLKELLLFAYLALHLRAQEHLAIDLRPRNILLEPFEWFIKTDNILIDEKGVRMIDTRWLWDLDASLVMRGGIIPEQTLLSTRTFITDTLKQL